MADNSKKKLCIVASAPSGIISFWKTNIEKLAPHFDVYVVANFTDEKVFDGLCIKGAKSVNAEMNAYLFHTKEELLEKLPELLIKGDSILIKASHFMQFEKIVKTLEG